MALLVLVTVTVVPFMQYQVSVMQLPDAFLAVLAVRESEPTAYLQPLVDGIFRCSPAWHLCGLLCTCLGSQCLESCMVAVVNSKI